MICYGQHTRRLPLQYMAKSSITKRCYRYQVKAEKGPGEGDTAENYNIEAAETKSRRERRAYVGMHAVKKHVTVETQAGNDAAASPDLTDDNGTGWFVITEPNRTTFPDAKIASDSRYPGSFREPYISLTGTRTRKLQLSSDLIYCLQCPESMLHVKYNTFSFF